jgi:hypothetical protein
MASRASHASLASRDIPGALPKALDIAACSIKNPLSRSICPNRDRRDEALLGAENARIVRHFGHDRTQVGRRRSPNGQFAAMARLVQ